MWTSLHHINIKRLAFLTLAVKKSVTRCAFLTLHQAVNGVSKSNHCDDVKSTEPAMSLVRQISQARLMAIRRKRSNLTNSFSTQDNGNARSLRSRLNAVSRHAHLSRFTCGMFLITDHEAARYIFENCAILKKKKKEKKSYFQFHVRLELRFGVE